MQLTRRSLARGAAPLGYLQGRHAREIGDSPWGIHAHGAFLFPNEYPVQKIHEMTAAAGVKWARVVDHWYRYDQGGQYDWRLLDVELGRIERLGMKPLITFYQQVPDYLRTGEVTDWNFPADARAFSAFLRYIGAFCRHFRGRVKHYQFFNEPTETKHNWSIKDYAKVISEAGAVIRSVDPDARILPYTPTGSNDSKWQVAVLNELLATESVRAQTDILSYHHYRPQPEAYPELHELIAAARAIKPHVPFWTTEAGYPSSGDTIHGTFSSPWGMNIQAKYLLRNFLLDQHNDVEKTFLFSNVEFYSRDPSRGEGFNSKGFIQHTTWQPKPSYYAFRNVAAVIDDTWRRSVRRADIEVVANGSFWGIGPHEQRFPCTPFQVVHETPAGPAISYWLPWMAQEFVKPGRVRLSLPDADWKEPVVADLLTGEIHEPTPSGTGFELPLFDYPVVLAERRALAVARVPQQPEYEAVVRELRWNYRQDSKLLFR